MKRLILLITILFTAEVTCINLMAKTPSADYDPIEWENKNDPICRSIFPISGYVDGHIITIHLYESPSEATVRIIDERGTIIYENVYDNPQPLVIEVEASATGSYEITVEYDGKAFVGHFVL